MDYMGVLERLGFRDVQSVASLGGHVTCPCSSCAVLPIVDDELKESLGELTTWKKALVQMNVTYFGPALGLAAYSGLWKSLHTSFWVSCPEQVWYVLWFLALFTFVLTTVLYGMRAFLSLALLRRDFNCNRLVCFFFAPLIVTSSLVLATPSFMVNSTLSIIAFYSLLVYQFGLTLYIYGDWLFGRKYSLKKVTPVYQMSIIGYFLVASLGAEFKQVEAAVMLYSIGVLFWVIVITVLFLRLSSSFKSAHEAPSPSLVLFVAPPAAAALGWSLIERAEHTDMSFEESYRGLATFFFYVDFYFILLVIRISRSFGNQPFAVASWAVIFPASTAASAMVTVAFALRLLFWQIIATICAALATIAILYVAIFTIINLLRGKFVRDPAAVDTYAASVLDHPLHVLPEDVLHSSYERRSDSALGTV